MLQTEGRPIDAATRDHFELGFGHDFSKVRIHTDALADQSARELNASAYAAGNHVVFRKDRYRPDTGRGRALLAHELTHVIQQGQSLPSTVPLSVGPTEDLAERNARSVAERFVRKPEDTQAPVMRLTTPRIQRMPESDSEASTDVGQTGTDDFRPSWIDSAVNMMKEYGAQVGELALGLTPVVGDAYDLVTAIVGETLISKEKLDPLDRLLSLAGLIPIPGVSGKVLRMARDTVQWTLKRLGFNPLELLMSALRKSASVVRAIWSRAKAVLPTLIEKYRRSSLSDETGAVGKDISGLQKKNRNRRNRPRVILNASEQRKLRSLRNGNDIEVETVKEARRILDAMPEMRPFPEDKVIPPRLEDPAKLKKKDKKKDKKKKKKEEEEEDRERPGRSEREMPRTERGTYRGDLINMGAPADRLSVHGGDHGKHAHYNLRLPNGKDVAILIVGKR
ncbi:MAG: DUF4157 domain-containing protein [Planctomycetota bacterium]